MYNVNFKTEFELYTKFKIINTIKKEKHQDVLTMLIKKHVIENNKLLENPEIQQVIQPTLPSFFDNPDDWGHYVGTLDNIGYVKMAIRFMFLQYLLLYHKYDRHHKNEFLPFLKDNKDSFNKSDDRSYLAKFGIFRAVKDQQGDFGSDLFSTRSTCL
jgi:hypothetical protein